MSEQITMMNPSQILADDNLRFGLKPSKVKNLAEKIAEAGRVNEPLEAETLASPQNGFTHRLTVGHYRLAAVQELIKNGTVMEVPVIVRERDSQDRLLRQLSENRDRENLTPMDCAIAIKRLMDSGMSRMDIRKQFPRPIGAKGNKTQPASNAWVNMMLSFLDFPKPIQQKIHAGEEGGGIAVTTAYLLHKCDKEKWEAITAKAEADVVARLEQEEKDETKYLESEKKQQEAKAKEEAAKKEVGEAQVKAQAAIQDVREKREAAIKAYEAAHTEMEEEKRKAKQAELEAAEKAAQEAEKVAAKAKKEAEKLEGKVKTAAQIAEERRKQLADARAANKPPVDKAHPPIPKAKDVQKAAQDLGANKNFVALNASQIRQSIETLCLAGTTEKVKLIAEACKEHFSGVTTPAQFYTKLQKIVGEYVERKKDTKKKGE